MAKLKIQSILKFIDNEDKFLEYLHYKIKVIGLKNFKVEAFGLLYPEKFLGFTYIDDLFKLQQEYLDKLKIIDSEIKEIKKEKGDKDNGKSEDKIKKTT